MWKDLKVTATVVTVNQKGIVSLPRDPRISDGKIAHVSISALSHPDLRAAELDISLRYDYKFMSNFSGGSGSSGFNGSDGLDGPSIRTILLPVEMARTAAMAPMDRMEAPAETPHQCRFEWHSDQETIHFSRWPYPQEAIRSFTWWIPRAVR